MYRHGNIVAKRVVVEHIDREEESNIYEPALYWNTIRFEEQRWAFYVKMGDIANRCDEKKL
jgi:hypothetical protein